MSDSGGDNVALKLDKLLMGEANRTRVELQDIFAWNSVTRANLGYRR